MHLRSTATEQVNKSWVEGHDGVPHVNDIIIAVLDNISITGHNHNNQSLQWPDIIYHGLSTYITGGLYR